MKKEFSLLLLILSSFLLCTCDFETTVEIRIPEEKEKLVVNCIFQLDSTGYPSFSHSGNILTHQNANTGIGDTAYNRIPNAVAKLHSGGNEIPILFHEKYPFYRSTSKATGNDYTIEVSAPGYESVTATTTIPRPVQITEIQSGALLPTPIAVHVEKREIHVHFRDPANESNYYGISIYAKVKNSTREVLWHPWPTPLNPVYAEDYYTEIFNTGNDNGNPEYTIIFNDRLFNGLDNDFSVWCYENEEDTPWSGKVEEYYVILKSISEEHYNYRVTHNLQQKANHDPYAQPVQVFNNINNGFGIFAGYSVSRITHKIR